MITISCFQSCIFLTTTIAGLSGFKTLDGGEDVGESLLTARRSDPDFVRADGIMRSLRSVPVFEQGILRKLKRSSFDDIGERSSMLNNGILRTLKRSALPSGNIHTNGLMRSVRSVDKRSLVSIPKYGNDQDDEETTYFIDEKEENLNRGLRSALPEEMRSIRASLIPKHPYDGLTLRYL